MAQHAENADADANSRLYRIRHSAAHIMAQAVCEQFPEAKLAIGPPIKATAPSCRRIRGVLARGYRSAAHRPGGGV